MPFNLIGQPSLPNMVTVLTVFSFEITHSLTEENLKKLKNPSSQLRNTACAMFLDVTQEGMFT